MPFQCFNTYLLVFVFNFRMKVLIEFGNSAKKVNFEDDVNFEKCVNTISTIFDLNIERIKLQVFDNDFNAFSDLEDMSEIKNLCRIRVIDNLGSLIETKEEVAILPSEDLKNLRRRSWNASNFSISLNSFSLASQDELSAAEILYASTEKLHKASYKLKREIIDILSKELTFYSLYPTQEMYKSTTETLIKVFPFLRDPIGNGTSCWSIALKYRMQEVRRKTKVDEVTVNAGTFYLFFK